MENTNIIKEVKYLIPDKIEVCYQVKDKTDGGYTRSVITPTGLTVNAKKVVNKFLGRSTNTVTIENSGLELRIVDPKKVRKINDSSMVWIEVFKKSLYTPNRCVVSVKANSLLNTLMSVKGNLSGGKLPGTYQAVWVGDTNYLRNETVRFVSELDDSIHVDRVVSKVLLQKNKRLTNLVQGQLYIKKISINPVRGCQNYLLYLGDIQNLTLVGEFMDRVKATYYNDKNSYGLDVLGGEGSLFRKSCDFTGSRYNFKKKELNTRYHVFISVSFDVIGESDESEPVIDKCAQDFINDLIINEPETILPPSEFLDRYFKAILNMCEANPKPILNHLGLVIEPVEATKRLVVAHSDKKFIMPGINPDITEVLSGLAGKYAKIVKPLALTTPVTDRYWRLFELFLGLVNLKDIHGSDLLNDWADMMVEVLTYLGLQTYTGIFKKQGWFDIVERVKDLTELVEILKNSGIELHRNVFYQVGSVASIKGSISNNKCIYPFNLFHDKCLLREVMLPADYDIVENIYKPVLEKLNERLKDYDN